MNTRLPCFQTVNVLKGIELILVGSTERAIWIKKSWEIEKLNIYQVK